MKRRPFATFSLSFIDAILCGFGAVILLFLIINAQSRSHRIEQTLALRAEADTLQSRITLGRRNLVQIRNSLDEQTAKIKRFEGLSRQVIEIQHQKQQQLARLQKDNLSTKAHINRLRADVKSSQEANKRLEAGGSVAVEQGERLREHAGDGHRQYLTGLNLKGRRTLILLDSSASMLAETIVNAVVRKNLPDAQKRRSPKWRRALAIIDWITTQLPADAEFQLYAFNKKAFAVLPDTSAQWLSTSDPQALNKAVRAARGLVPDHGTDLAGAFSIASRLKPRADNILLISV
ncbi:MAG: VWA domain-containing protein [gamma proteobacterium symbiont of Bathyaustriella thionipta]|nr:VWA domain-containing protein [gamma proteobacterium symbiont of Bathyaustriella thionipta]